MKVEFVEVSNNEYITRTHYSIDLRVLQLTRKQVSEVDSTYHIAHVGSRLKVSVFSKLYRLENRMKIYLSIRILVCSSP